MIHLLAALYVLTGIALLTTVFWYDYSQSGYTLKDQFHAKRPVPR